MDKVKPMNHIIIHQIFWPFKDKELDEIPSFKKCVARTKKYCKKNGYQHRMWNLKMCEELIIDKYPQYLCLWSEFRFDIQRCDFIRYLILHQYGGWYVDCDVYPIQNLNCLHNNDEVFTSWSNDKAGKPYNAVMYSCRGNSLFMNIAEKVQERVQEKQDMKIYDTWKGRLVFQTTGHHMLKTVVPKSSIHDLMLIHNEKKEIYEVSDNPYFFDENASIWFN